MSIHRDDARAILTDKQFDAWDLHERGMSPRSIARELRISRTSVNERLESARRNIDKHQNREAA